MNYAQAVKWCCANCVNVKFRPSGVVAAVLFPPYVDPRRQERIVASKRTLVAAVHWLRRRLEEREKVYYHDPAGEEARR